jgi:hypothetical protein
MPFFDGTGPLGRGPMTGRGMGYCGSFWRRPWRFGARNVQPSKESLKAYKEELLAELKAIEEEEGKI